MKPFNNISGIPLYAFLRGNPYSDRVLIKQDGDKSEDFITDDIFWGNNSASLNLFSEYINNNESTIYTSEAFSPQALVITRKGNDCYNWINENIINPYDICSKLLVVQGFAGCGKTTFLNYCKRKIETTPQCQFNILDLSKGASQQNEDRIFYVQLLKLLTEQIVNILKGQNGKKIYTEFINLICSCGNFEIILSEGISLYLREQFNLIQTSITDDNQQFDKKFIDDFIYDFKYHISSYCDLKDKLNIEPLVAMYILIFIAKNNIISTPNKKEYLVFDNLDIITHPNVTAQNIKSLHSIMSRYIGYVNDTVNNKIAIEIIVTVRKVLYSHLVGYFGTPEMEKNDWDSTVVCDISKLFSIDDIMTKRINYWLSSSPKICPKRIKDKLYYIRKFKLYIFSNMNSTDTNTMEQSVEDYIFDYEIPKTSIDLANFVNQNYRAFSNLIDKILSDNNCIKILSKAFSSSPNKNSSIFKSSALLYVMCYVYQQCDIWAKMGFGCHNCNKKDYPTTLSRIILTYLYVCKSISLYKDKLNRRRKDLFSITSIKDEVSLTSILKVLGKVSFLQIDSNHTDIDIENKYQVVNQNDRNQMIFNRLAEMCDRNTFDSVETYDERVQSVLELWRRPLFFTRNVSVKNIKCTNDELVNCFQTQVNENRNPNETAMFSITEEGGVFVKDIIMNFEFYSARYNCKCIKPLWQADNKDEIDLIIKPVYKAIKTCCERQIFFMIEYIKNNLQKDVSNIETEDKDNYLKQFFHPRTNIRRDHDGLITEDSFRPQLHIVRVLFAHIIYFNEIKKHSDISIDMRKKLTEYIIAYLKLYSDNFKEMLTNTVGEYNNTVFTELNALANHQKSIFDDPNSNNENIDISRKNTELLKKLGLRK